MEPDQHRAAVELPDDALLMLVSRLAVVDLCRAACVSRQWRRVCYSKTLWTEINLTCIDASRVTHKRLLNLVARAQGGLQSLTLPRTADTTPMHLRPPPELSEVALALIVQPSPELVFISGFENLVAKRVAQAFYEDSSTSIVETLVQTSASPAAITNACLFLQVTSALLPTMLTSPRLTGLLSFLEVHGHDRRLMMAALHSMCACMRLIAPRPAAVVLRAVWARIGAALVTFIEDEAVVRTCLKLADICAGLGATHMEGLRGAFCFAELFAAMRAHVYSASVLVNAIQTLISMICDTQSGLEASAAGAILAIAAALRTHTNSAELQTSGLGLLAHMTINYSDQRSIAGAAGAIEICVAALNVHRSHVRVQEIAFAALINITRSDMHNGRKARDAGAVGAVLAGMIAHISNASIQESGLKALSNMAAGDPSNLAKACGTGAIEAIVNGLGAHVSNAAVQARGCEVIKYIAEHGASQVFKAVDAGAIEAVVAAMQAHSSDGDVVFASCDTLVGILWTDYDLCVRAGRAGAVAAVVNALPAQVNERVATLCLGTLNTLLLRNTHNKVMADIFGAIQIVVTSMRAHSHSGRLQTEGCVLLERMTSNADNSLTGPGLIPFTKHIAFSDRVSRTAKAVSAGGIEAVVSAMYRHAESCSMQTQACKALSSMTLNSADNRVRACGVDAVEAVVNAMCKHEDDIHLLEAALSALVNLTLNCAGNQEDAGPGSGAVEAIVAAMRTSVVHAGVQRYGLWALKILVGSDDHNCLDASCAGAIPAVLAAMRVHTSNVDVQEYGCCVLGNLAMNDTDDRWEASILGAMQATVTAMRAHASHMGVQEFGCRALACMVDENPYNAMEGDCVGAKAAVEDAMRTHATCAAVQRQGIYALDKLTNVVWGTKPDEDALPHMAKALKKAALDGRTDQVALLIQRGADVHANVDQALRLAAQKGHTAVVTLLLHANADIHADNDGALENACFSGEAAMIELLIQHGATVSTMHAYIDEALLFACEQGDADTVAILLEYGADIHADGDAALQHAAALEHQEVVELLVAQGADIESTLFEAARNDDEVVVASLIECGADVHADSDAALQWACAYGSFGVVSVLLEHGADVRAVEDWALARAMSSDHTDVVQLLIEHGLKDPDEEEENSDNMEA